MKKILVLILFLQGWLMGAQLKQIEINGVKVDVIYEQSDYIPTVSMQIIFRQSGFLNESKLGLASFSADMLNEGTHKEGSFAFAQKLDARAITLHVNSGDETFGIEVESLKEYFDEGVALLVELLNDPNYTQEAYQKVLKQALGRIEKNKTDFDYVASRQLKAMVFDGTYLAYPKIGTKESLESITIDDVKGFIADALTLNNVVVVAGGDISFEELSGRIQKILSPLSKRDTSSLQTFAMKPIGQTKEYYEKTQQAYIYFAAPFAIDYNATDQYKAKVAASILGASGFGSRMIEEIRVKRGLAYSAYCYFVNHRYINYFTGAMQTKIESQKEAIDVVKAMVKDFVAKGVTQEELTKAKKYILGSEPLKNESLSQRLSKAFYHYYHDKPLDYSQQELELIDKLTLEQLNGFIASHPEIAKLSFAVVTAKEDKK
ncbi:MAG: hypothetical protein KU28_07270 [Sulfurovum sp. PC08-66]|nr:MAG: hypothetical protein KU28_07270 [Sulfurovum sp. PC08-66]